ncbi:MAG: hypothetical protein KKF62_11155 [Bacteroidetes bacterium]|nr:hypothetical protein [Bacteroidota bacterium]MBU1113834.1 hypothetical protein [Bacteroidota bacterium]MBU1798208.1 hypothetical protein [Bacteroidota bacterium]
MKIKKYYDDFKRAFSNIKWEYILNFLAMVFGVLLGFWLTNYQNDLSLETDAITKIEFMQRECDYNKGNGYEIKIILSDTSSFQKLYPKMSINSILLVINDPYILNVLNYDLYNLFMGYLQTCENINYIVPLYNEHLIASEYKVTKDNKNLRQSLVQYISYFLAYTKVVQNEISTNYNIKNQYTKKKKEYDKQIDSLKKLFLQNKVNLYEY